MKDSLPELLDALGGSPDARQRAAARLMTLFQDDPARLPDLLALARPRLLSQPVWILGVTGPPGAGKSSLIGAMVSALRQRSADTAIGIVAVDPSSSGTGGAVLGDRVRMMQHATDRNVFIRSVAARGHLGGITGGLVAMLTVQRLLGCSYIFVETVGVGQSEVEVARVVDHVALVLTPGQGDSVQLLKSGIMEIADTILINKSDLPQAAEFHASVVQHLHMTSRSDAPPADALLVSAANRSGIEDFIDSIGQVAANNAEAWKARREAAILTELQELLVARFVERVRSQTDTLQSAATRLRYASSTLRDEVDRLAMLLPGAASRHQ